MPKVSTKELYNFLKLHRGVTTDTREINQGDLFFALKGPNFDGNKFAEKAIEDGAAFAVVETKTNSDENIRPKNTYLLSIRFSF